MVKIGKSKAITGTEICNKMNLSGRLKSYKLTPVKLRKIISRIRVKGIISALCSSSKGYFVADTLEELETCLKSLSERLRQQQMVVDALTVQLHEEHQRLSK